jgi:A118 family predicted phage portal protein
MKLINQIKNFLGIGKMANTPKSLQNITDHPKIGIDSKEYTRIDKDKQFFEGSFPKVRYRNSYGEIQERDYIALNMAKLAVRRMASILFNEKAEITIDEEISGAEDWVQEFLRNNDFNKNFERYLESALALGGLAMRPYWDNVLEQMKISFVQAPVFFPLKSNTGDVSEAAIATKTTRTEGDKQVYYTLLEFHEWNGRTYTISNELYKSDDKRRVGDKISLSTIYPDLAEQTSFENLTRPLFTYLKPAGFNNKDITSPLGLSIYDNSLTTLKQLNDTYDQFNWEIRMGQRRVAVPDQLMDTVFRRDSDNPTMQKPFRQFDPDQNVFLALPMGQDESTIQDLTTPIRAEEYIRTLNQFIKTLEMELGFSSGTFSFDGQSVKTATEVISENSMTYQTRSSHLTLVERSIQELIISACELGSVLGVYSGQIPDLDNIHVNFDDGIFTDKNSQLNYYLKGIAGGVFSQLDAIQKTNGVNEEEALEILNQIRDEQSYALDNNSGFNFDSKQLDDNDARGRE